MGEDLLHGHRMRKATPAMAGGRDRAGEGGEGSPTKPIRYVVLTHYHAVRVLGASAYGRARGVIASDATYRLIEERGQQDWESEFGRFPRLFQDAESIPGLTWPNLVFGEELTVFLGKREVKLYHLGAGHTAGDIVAWVPDAEVMFSGDLVDSTPPVICGDSESCANWPGRTLTLIRGFSIRRRLLGPLRRAMR